MMLQTALRTGLNRAPQTTSMKNKMMTTSRRYFSEQLTPKNDQSKYVPGAMPAKRWNIVPAGAIMVVGFFSPVFIGRAFFTF